MLYNNYRPSTLNEVIGQDSIVSVLKSAIEANKLSHSILFSGLHGCGKTSIARILAKEVGCDTVDIIELDAASHNSVDDIRQLIQQARIPPHSSKFKTYIIDEVHMLSSAAFNALLKILEEPPKHCKFILCTTEKRKIIPTVLSRCQLFDLKEIEASDIKIHLINVCTKEKIEYEEAALEFIANEAAGSMRDALSMLELCQDDCKLETLQNKLGIVGQEAYLKLIELINLAEIDNALIYFNSLIKSINVQRLVGDIRELIRDLFMFKSIETEELVIASKEIKDKMRTVYNSLGTSFCFTMLNEFNNEFINSAKTNQAVILQVEIALVKLILQRKKISK